MSKRHSLLARQLKKSFGSEDRLSGGLVEFVAAVEAAYRQFDEDRGMLERSLDLSSQELMARNSEMRAVLRAFPDVFFRLDSDGLILDCTASRSEDLYLPAEQFVGKRMQNVIPNGVGRKFEEAIREVLSTSKIASLEYRLAVPSGDKHWEARIVKDAGGQLLVIVRDITERMKSQEALRRSEDQHRQAQKMELVGRLAGGIAHDFNNLLTTILGLSEMAAGQLPAGEPLADDLKEIAATARRAANLTHQLLAFSRCQVVEPKIISLNDAIPGVTKMLRRLIGENIELVAQLGPSLGLVRVDPGQLEQVIVNLCVNARDAMPKGGILTLETSNFKMDEGFAHENPGALVGDYVRLAVVDTGSGMSDEVKAHVFEPFFTTKEQGRGTGLGLATCYGIAKQNSGYITVRSEPGRGATFCIYLPKAEGATAAEEFPPEARPKDIPRGSETVLVVEDDEPLRRLAVRVLRMQGYDVLEAADGEQGLRVVEADASRRIRLVITDMVMPRCGGKQLAEALSTLRPDIRLLVATGYTDVAMFERHNGLRSAALLHKPFTPRGLAEKVRDSLG